MFRFLLVWIGRILISFGLIAIGVLAFAALIGLAAAGTAFAQDRRQNAPGEFDYYVLSLSWSPSFCEEASERGNEGRSQAQCGGRPFSFVVHGLWPQYEHGFPEYCQKPSPRLDRNIMTSMLDEMPAPGLIYNEWDKHGTCSGLSPRAYFETIRKARSAVKIPEEYLQLSEPKTVAPDAIEDAFIKANPGLSNSAIAVTCNRNRLSEVRICLSKDLQFRSCEEIDRRGCRRDQVVMPPMRGG
ncbi:ribonuclease T2 [Bradyrhizobium lablabi]|uniref:Ribonuclease T2 n=1 Tax=Bradyrhizobium lablabi TaxID=722472 RepID=A0A1M6YPE3_9BRAD|nr:ribonuclease T2 [Bradyrhizobium lablabi]SHL20126.1 ribonuclease T2 [Bradyrhizobium lablabi]